jgi:hypothetical protein
MNSREPLRHPWRRPSQFIGVVTALIVMACRSVTDAEPSEFTIRVDSISGPTAVSGGIAWEQRLWGVVGPAGCTSVKEVRTTRVPSTMDVTVIGEHLSGAACLPGTVALDGLSVRLEPIIPPDFSLVVHQPDGSTLVRRVHGE